MQCGLVHINSAPLAGRRQYPSSSIGWIGEKKRIGLRRLGFAVCNAIPVGVKHLHSEPGDSSPSRPWAL